MYVHETTVKLVFISNFQIVKEVDEATYENLGFDAEKARGLKASLQKFAEVINGIKLKRNGNGTPCTKHTGGYILELLEKASVSHRLKFLRKMKEIPIALKTN